MLYGKPLKYSNHVSTLLEIASLQLRCPRCAWHIVVSTLLEILVRVKESFFRERVFEYTVSTLLEILERLYR